MFASGATACVLANLGSAPRGWDSRCVDDVPTAVRDIGSRQRRVSLRHIYGLRRHPVEQAEISAPHGPMGKLLSLQPLLKSHHHRTDLRTVSQALSPRKGTPLLLTHGERRYLGLIESKGHWAIRSSLVARGMGRRRPRIELPPTEGKIDRNAPARSLVQTVKRRD